jgi:hypothetical protein
MPRSSFVSYLFLLQSCATETSSVAPRPRLQWRVAQCSELRLGAKGRRYVSNYACDSYNSENLSARHESGFFPRFAIDSTPSGLGTSMQADTTRGGEEFINFIRIFDCCTRRSMSSVLSSFFSSSFPSFLARAKQFSSSSCKFPAHRTTTRRKIDIFISLGLLLASILD